MKNGNIDSSIEWTRYYKLEELNDTASLPTQYLDVSSGELQSLLHIEERKLFETVDFDGQANCWRRERAAAANTPTVSRWSAAASATTLATSSIGPTTSGPRQVTSFTEFFFLIALLASQVEQETPIVSQSIGVLFVCLILILTIDDIYNG